MAVHKIELDAEQEQFLEASIESGIYRNENEAVQAGLLLLKQQEIEYQEKVAHFRAEVLKGMDDLENGRYIEIKNKEELDAYFAGIRKEGRERLKEVGARVEANQV